MSAPLRVLVVDDELLFAELMRVALGSATDMQVVDVVHDVAGAVAATRTAATTSSRPRDFVR